MDEGGAGVQEAGHALDSYYADGDYGDEKMRQVSSGCRLQPVIQVECLIDVHGHCW